MQEARRSVLLPVHVAERVAGAMPEAKQECSVVIEARSVRVTPFECVCDAKEQIRGVYMRNISSEAEGLYRKLLRESRLVLDVKVIPRSHSGKVEDVMANGKLKVKVRAAPEGGKANDEVCAVLAEYLGVPKGNVHVILGRTSQQKRISIAL
jgi:hypothetical protein